MRWRRRNRALRRRLDSACGALVVVCLLVGCAAEDWTTDGDVVLDLTDELSVAPLADPEGAIPSPRPETSADGSRLHLPFGATADYHLRLPAGSVLRLERVDLRGDGGSRLAIRIRPAFGEEVELALLARTNGPERVDLGEFTGTIVRLSLEALPGAPGEPGGFTLARPRIVTLPPASVPGSSPEPEARSAPADRPNLIVYLVDTLRADHLGTYGYESAVTPNFDRLAAQSTLFEQVVAQSSWTRASVASMVTGFEPHIHRVQDRMDALSSDALTLAEMLSAAGYTTIGVVTNGNVGPKFGFDQGFDLFTRPERPRYRSSDVNERIFELLEEGALEEPFLLWVHTLDPHHPYEPPEEFRRGPAEDPAVLELGTSESLKSFRRGEREVNDSIREQVISLYDSEITCNDHYFGLLVERLKERGLWENSVVVLVSDHGEEFWEHENWGHGHTLFGEQLSIPLIVKEPGQREPRRVTSLVQLTDLAPTLLDWAGVPVPASLPGRSLRDAPLSVDPAAERPVYSHLDLDHRTAAAVTELEWKLIVPRSGPYGRRPMVFRRADDPSDSRALRNPDPVVAGYLSRLLRGWEEGESGETLEAVEATLDPALVEELKALGYLQ